MQRVPLAKPEECPILGNLQNAKGGIIEYPDKHSFTFYVAGYSKSLDANMPPFQKVYLHLWNHYARLKGITERTTSDLNGRLSTYLSIAIGQFFAPGDIADDLVWVDFYAQPNNPYNPKAVLVRLRNRGGDDLYPHYLGWVPDRLLEKYHEYSESFGDAFVDKLRAVNNGLVSARVRVPYSPEKIALIHQRQQAIQEKTILVEENSLDRLNSLLR